MFGNKGRIPLYAAAGAVVMASLSLATPAHAASSSDWPTYLDNRARTGFNAAERLITRSNVGGMHRVWTFSSGSVSAEPMRVGGVVYYGSWDGHERAVNASTGKQLWSR
ncbi:MAG: hypothetical protein LBV34_25915, partial [Nocardiopsaceae bacterium]|nr:hypothetical protein [Nocardiopsaceae bacterium]